MPFLEARFLGGGVEDEPVSDAASDSSSLRRSLASLGTAGGNILGKGASPCETNRKVRSHARVQEKHTQDRDVQEMPDTVHAGWSTPTLRRAAASGCAAPSASVRYSAGAVLCCCSAAAVSTKGLCA